jgi:hypothetical protein
VGCVEEVVAADGTTDAVRVAVVVSVCVAFLVSVALVVSVFVALVVSVSVCVLVVLEVSGSVGVDVVAAGFSVRPGVRVALGRVAVTDGTEAGVRVDEPDGRSPDPPQDTSRNAASTRPTARLISDPSGSMVRGSGSHDEDPTSCAGPDSSRRGDIRTAHCPTLSVHTGRMWTCRF